LYNKESIVDSPPSTLREVKTVLTIFPSESHMYKSHLSFASCPMNGRLSKSDWFTATAMPSQSSDHTPKPVGAFGVRPPQRRKSNPREIDLTSNLKFMGISLFHNTRVQRRLGVQSVKAQNPIPDAAVTSKPPAPRRPAATQRYLKIDFLVCVKVIIIIISLVMMRGEYSPRFDLVIRPLPSLHLKA